MITSYNVTGMTCEKCVAHITEEVREVPGVQHVDVQLEGGRMVIMSEQQIEFDKVKDAVSEAGNYSVAVAS